MATEVGINLSPVNYWSTQFPFIDRMKSAGGWSTMGTNAGSISYDANGYPTSMPTNASYVWTMVPLDPPTAGTNNVYVLSYTGTASFRIPGATIISSKPGEVTFRYNGTDAMQNVLMSGIDSKNPPTEIHIVRQDQVELFKQGEIFNPTFLDKTEGYGVLRFMDWANTNSSTVVEWADRTKTSAMSWAITNNKDGSVPIEVMVALANKTHSEIWLNVPTMASDDYVRQMMKYVADNLDKGLTIHLEYSNEVWNWSFAQSKYARDMANNMWGKDANGDGKIDPNDAAEAVTGGWLQYYGYRSAQIAKIAQDVLGSEAATRLDTVIATQTVNVGLERYIFAGIDRAGVGSASSLFGEYAVTTYFAWGMTGANASDRATLLSWARSGEAGMKAAFTELLSGGGLSGNTSLKSLASAYAYQAAVAKKYGLDLVAYEGGLHFSAAGFSTAEQKEIMAFYQKLQMDPRMKEVYTTMISDFEAAGGKLLAAFNDAQSDRALGLFGTLDSIYDTTSPSYEALKEAAAKAAGIIITKPVTGGNASEVIAAPPATSTETVTAPTGPTDGTTQATYVMGASEKSVTFTGTGLFTATGNDLANTITGGNGGNVLSGGAGNDTLVGGAGNDRLDGGTGADTMVGKGGDDIYFVDHVGDVVVEAANEGIDEVRTTLASYTLGANVENLTFTGTGAFTGYGNELNNVLIGGDGGAHLYGGAGNDTLIGGKGADYLDGGTGDDVMTGGAGNDIYIVDSVGDVVNELPGGGIDEVRTTLGAYTLGANVENLTFTGTGKYEGHGNELANVLTGRPGGGSLYGGAGNDTLIGSDGADYLDGGTGADRMVGGKGDDIYIVDDVRDVVVEALNEGIDEVRTSLNAYSLGANVENLTFTGKGTFMGYGNALDNVIVGGDGGARLNGGAGNDTLIGGAGNDTLDGGTGADRMVGGKGDDTYIVDDVNDVVVEDANGGYDTVFTTVSYTLSANVEVLRMWGNAAIDGHGNDLDNIIIGNAANNRLYGGGGRDTIWGGDGDDMIFGGDGDDNLRGDAGNDYLEGGAGNDVLDGGAGNDVLIGGPGADSLTGGAGADRFVFRPGDLGTVMSNTDRILDFNRAEGDKIDFSAFDANVNTAVRDAFTFIGSSAFTKHAGELRYDNFGGYWNVMGDIDGDGVADFVLNVSKGSGAPIASDFIL